jgi:hypothetical protein
MARRTHPRADPPSSRRRPRRPQDVPTCLATGKLRFRDKKSALQALHAVVAAAALNPASRRREQRVYKCQQCGGWHLTSQSARPRLDVGVSAVA